jgi:hypothetical protein
MRKGRMKAMNAKVMDISEEFHLYADLRTLAEDIEEEYLEASYLWAILSDPKHDYWDWIDDEVIEEEFDIMIENLHLAGEKYQLYMQQLAELLPRIQAENASA